MFAEVYAAFEQALFNLVCIVDFGYCHQCEFAQMTVYDNRLGVGIRNHAYACVAVEILEIVLEFRTEIIVFQTMNLTGETSVSIDKGHAGAACAQMRVVVGAVEDFVNATASGSYSIKTSHKFFYL